MANEYQTHNRPNIVGWLSDNQALPNTTSADSTNMVEIGGTTNGLLMISVFANTAISIADTKALTITFEAYSSDTAASAVFPASYNNSGGINQASGTALANGAGVMSFTFTASGGAMAWAAGDLIVEFAVPDTMCRLLEYDFVQLKYTTTANESSETVDAIVWARP